MRYIISYTLDKATADDGALLRMRIKWDKCRRICSVNVGYRVTPSAWIAAAGRCKPRTVHGRRRVPAAEINAEIERLEAIVRSAAAYFVADPPVAEFRRAIRLALGRDKEESTSVALMPAFNRYVSEQGKSRGWTPGTYDCYHTVHVWLARYAEQRGADLATLASDNLSAFVAYLREQGLQECSVTNVYMLAKSFVRWARSLGLAPPEEAGSPRPRMRKIDKSVIWLDEHEVQLLIDAHLDGALAQVRDMLVLQCYTGLRYSDVRALRHCDISDDRIAIVARKTSEIIEVGLTSVAKTILNRYQGAPDDYVFARHDANWVNRQLKVIARDCGIDTPVTKSYIIGGQRVDKTIPKWQCVSTHIGRRTFVCRMLQAGVPVTTLMSITGHSSYAAMLPYIGVADDARISAVKALEP